MSEVNNKGAKMDQELLDQLKVLLEQLNDRVEALEHTVNDTIIGGWKKADEEYKDCEAHKHFTETYGADLDKLSPYFQKLYGDDYNLDNELYNELKSTDGYGTESFDEDALMKAKIAELTDKFKDWDLNPKTEEPVKEAEETVVVTPEDKEYSELSDIYKKYKNGELAE